MKKSSVIYKAIFCVVLFTIIFAENITAADENNIAEKGIFTIDQYSPEKTLALNGEWEFYFNHLYKPEDFLNHTITEKREYVEVPKDWNHYDLPNQQIIRTGFATYRLLIHFPKTEIGKFKAIYIPCVSSAYKVWIDGEQKVAVGKVATTKRDEKPSDIPKLIHFQPKSEQVELIIQASNYHQRKSGLFDKIILGEPDVIHDFISEKIIYRSFVVCSLLIIGLYHFALFSLHKNDLSFLYFGSLCVAVAIRAMILDNDLGFYILSFMNWEIVGKIEYLGATLGTLFFTLFSSEQFPNETNRKLRNLSVFLMAIISLYIIFTPRIIHTITMLPMQIVIFFVFIYLLYVYILAYKHKRPGSTLNLVAISILVSCVVNDIIYYNDIIKTMEMTSIGLIVFLLSQSFNLSKEYARSFHKIEKLSAELQVFNESLEKEVAERTAELKISNEQLQNAYESRRRLLTNISHELGTPLTSIQGYTKAMADEVIPCEKKYLQLVNDKVVYLSKIFDDLLALTELETKQIEFEKCDIDIIQYCNQLFEKYKLELEKENILFFYENCLNVNKKYIVSIDPLRIEQVINNFLTNAKKFIKKNGQIIVRLSLVDKHTVRLECIDNGCGIDEQSIHYIFERFYKSYGSDNPNKGAGLGLAISKEIIEFHNGQIGVTSKVGEGSCFYFTLPLITEV